MCRFPPPLPSGEGPEEGVFKIMRKSFLFLLFPLFSVLLLTFTACEETEEPTAYDNWRERNDAFLDSLAAIAGNNYLVWRNPETRVTTDVPDMHVGELYAIEVQDGGTSAGLNYTYAKKLVDNPDGERLLYTDNVSVFYHGTYINGVEFDGNFEGYTALDQQIPLDPAQMIWPTPFDEPVTFSPADMIGGVKWTLQMARTGERWILYVPYYSNVGYGESDFTPSGSSTTIPAYSALTFDIVIGDLVEED